MTSCVLCSRPQTQTGLVNRDVFIILSYVRLEEEQSLDRRHQLRGTTDVSLIIRGIISTLSEQRLR